MGDRVLGTAVNGATGRMLELGGPRPTCTP